MTERATFGAELRRRRKAAGLSLTELAARTHYSKAIGDTWALATTTANLGVAHVDRGDLDEASAYYGEALALFRRIGDGHGETTTLAHSGWAEHYRGQHDDALRDLWQAHAPYVRDGNRSNVAIMGPTPTSTRSWSARPGRERPDDPPVHVPVSKTPAGDRPDIAQPAGRAARLLRLTPSRFRHQPPDPLSWVRHVHRAAAGPQYRQGVNLTDYRAPASDPPRQARRFVSSLAISVTTSSADTVVTVSGEIDLAVSDSLRKALEEELQFTPAALIADLSAVTFCDSSGFTALVQIRGKAETAGVPFILVTQERALLRPMSLLGLDAVFTVHPTLDSARDALTR
ncbi:anti-sigma factor antagonist [Amycolatopsis thailandensis]|uniref:anti-sigma factor antagonist n=1 Tax=Amycolatopsis thailandensis TaxID=589330 RepID=UPI001FC96074|nr:anti-sigma factor antagonist [Amycolatopsis thailandensis]